MKLETKYHGTIDYEEEDIIVFEKGIPGFENLKKFIVFTLTDNELFKIIHSLEDTDIGLIAVNPFDFMEDYEIKLTDEIVDNLKINKEEDVMILNTVTMNSKAKSITTNLKAPIIINIKEGLGEQLILDDDRYDIKSPLIKEC